MTKKQTKKKSGVSRQVPKSGGVKKGTAKSNAGVFNGTLGLWILLGMSWLAFLVTRVKLLAIPLERDEGSFAYIGHWLFRGKELYTDMLDSKLPGLYTYYGVFTTLFGYDASGVHMGLLVANVASGICMYLLLKDMYNRYVATIATMLFLWMIVSPNVLGFAAHATQVLTPFILGGFLLFWKGLQKSKLHLFFISGLLIGTAFTIKQQSAVFGILAAVIWWPARLWWNKKENSKLPILEWICLGAGGVLPAASVFLYFIQSGRFDLFYDWTVTQPVNLAASFPEPWYTMFFNMAPKVIEQFEGVWIAAGLGLLLIFLSGFKKFGAVFGLSFGLLGFISVIIGAAYYKHYFVVAIPGIALLASCTIYWVAQKIGKIGPGVGIGIAVILILISLHGRSDYYFHPDFAKIHYEAYSRNMFPEIEQLGQELKRRAPKGASIGVMGSEPEVLVAADRAGCSKYLMIYAILFDPVRSPPMQQEYIKELQDCSPEYIVWNTVTGSWSNGYDKLQFFEQLMEWLEANYITVALAESRGESPGVVVWEEGLNTYHEENNYKVYVLKKKEAALPPQG